MSRILSRKVVEELESDAELTRTMKNARQASDFLKALANEHRLLLLCLLAERERSVTDLEELLSLLGYLARCKGARSSTSSWVTTSHPASAPRYA